jgi:hypothetical protein
MYIFYIQARYDIEDISNVNIYYQKSVKSSSEFLFIEESAKDSKENKEIKFDLASISKKLEYESICKVCHHINFYSFVLYSSNLFFDFYGNWKVGCISITDQFDNIKKKCFRDPMKKNHAIFIQKTSNLIHYNFC